MITSASAAAHRLRPLFSCCSPLLPDCSCCSPLASASAAAPDCVHFNCSPFRLLLPDCVCFNCCSPIASTLQLLLPDCVRFDCCSPIASASTAAPRLHASACSPSWIPVRVLYARAQCSRSFFAEFEIRKLKYKVARH